MSDFYPLKVIALKRETPKAVSVTFEIPETLKDTFAFKAGQYVTIKKEVDGQEVRRAYSICEAPESGILKVAVKEVQGGTFSKHANQELAEGDVLAVMPPDGRFIFEPSAKANHIAAFAAGSGITPIMSIAKTVLAQPENTFTLMYGNRSVAQTIFYEELLQMRARYPERFHLYFTFSRASEAEALSGRIERSTVNYIMKNKHKDLNFDAFYLCGPKPMIDLISEALQEQGIAEENIWFELFTEAEAEQPLNADLEGMTHVTVTVDDEEFSFVMPQESKVLDVALAEGIDAPYSCQGGVCSSCIARITEGAAVMEKNQILTDGELEQGFVLTCQAHPTTPTIHVDYDDV